MIPPVGTPLIFAGYRSILKKEWRKGKLPTVKYGFYGEELTQENLSLEHLRARSKDGHTELSNLVLASKKKNNERGNGDLNNFAERKTVTNYLLQFMGVKLKKFNGDKYIQNILNTLDSLGFTL